MSDHCYYVLPCDSKSDPLHRRIQQMTGGYCITSGWLTCPCQLGGSGLLVLLSDRTNKTTHRISFALKNRHQRQMGSGGVPEKLKGCEGSSLDMKGGIRK